MNIQLIHGVVNGNLVSKMLLSTGRGSTKSPSIHLWHQDVSRSSGAVGLLTGSWSDIDVAQHHNEEVRAMSRPDLVLYNGSGSISTCYTDIREVTEREGVTELLMVYDRLANGWKPPPGPGGATNFIFAVTVNVSFHDRNVEAHDRNLAVTQG